MTKLGVVFFASATLLFIGCSGSEYSIAPVSGKVTFNGQPVSDLAVIFTPMPNKENTDPGPWSKGVTNAQGEFTLVTRHKNKGASVGNSTVSFEYEDAEDMDDLKDDLDEAMSEDGSREEVEEVKKRIAAYQQKRAGRPKIPESLTLYFEVAKGGTTEANFELSEHLK